MNTLKKFRENKKLFSRTKKEITLQELKDSIDKLTNNYVSQKKLNKINEQKKYILQQFHQIEDRLSQVKRNSDLKFYIFEDLQELQGLLHEFEQIALTN